MSAETLDVTPLTPAIGAVIHGIDLSEPLKLDVVDAIERCLFDRLVVFFRDQHITDDDLMAFGRYFGDLELHPYLPNAGGEFESVQVLENDGDPTSPTRPDEWHSDRTFDVEPSMGSVLRAVTLPELGGDTIWSNMYTAYDSLSEPMRSMIDALDATHGSGYGARLEAPNVHPVVRRHPITERKALFVNRIFTSKVNGLSPVEARGLLETLLQHCESPMFQVRWRWRVGDVAFWDNRCTQHYGVYDYVGLRVLHRVTIRGDRPIR